MPASKCFKKSRRERRDIVADKKKSHLSKRFRCEMTKMKIKKRKIRNQKKKKTSREMRNRESEKKKKNCFSKRKTIQQQTIRLAELAQTPLR